MLHGHKHPDTVSGDENALPAPCPQMRVLISGLSDGSVGGVGRWYAERHIEGCPHCSAALGSLIVLETRLRNLGEARQTAHSLAAPVALAPERRAYLDKAMAALDAGNDA